MLSFRIMLLAFVSIVAVGCGSGSSAPIVAPSQTVTPEGRAVRQTLCVGSMLLLPNIADTALRFGKTAQQLAEDVCGYAVPVIEAAAGAAVVSAAGAPSQ